ncbi:MAG: hypothetical protein ABIP17_07575 [Ilumatobacteraceae bacterium]
MTRRQITTIRSTGLAAFAIVSVLLAPASVFADEPAPETGQVDGAVVAVGQPPVPPTTVVVAVGQPPVPPTPDVVAVGQPPVPPTADVVAVGQPPVPPTADVVAVGQPPVPPTADVVAVGQPPVPKAPTAVRRQIKPAPVFVVSPDALRSTADAALDVLDAWF